MGKITSCVILLGAAALAACATQAPATLPGTDTGHDTGVAAAAQSPSAAAPRLAATPPKDVVPPKGEVVVEGYRQVLVNGQPVYCRDELATGSHLKKDQVCLTKAQLLAEQARAQQFIQDVQRSGAIGGGGSTMVQGGVMSY
jgi:hypothetical protein